MFRYYTQQDGTKSTRKVAQLTMDTLDTVVKELKLRCIKPEVYVSGNDVSMLFSNLHKLEQHIAHTGDYIMMCTNERTFMVIEQEDFENMYAPVEYIE